MLYVFHNDRTVFAGSPEEFVQELHNAPGVRETIDNAIANGSEEFSDRTAGNWQFVYKDETVIRWCNKFKVWAHEADALELTYDCRGCDSCTYCELVDEQNAQAFEKAMNEKMMDEPFTGEIPGFMREGL